MNFLGPEPQIEFSIALAEMRRLFLQEALLDRPDGRRAISGDGGRGILTKVCGTLVGDLCGALIPCGAALLQGNGPNVYIEFAPDPDIIIREEMAPASQALVAGSVMYNTGLKDSAGAEFMHLGISA